MEMKCTDFQLGDSVIISLEMFKVVDIFPKENRIVVESEENGRRIVVNPEDLHF